MAAETGIPSVYLEHQLSHGRAAKKTQESLIDRLKHKNSQIHSWNDSIKIVRNSIAEHRLPADVNGITNIQKCLDAIQKAMKVISQQNLKERLDSIGRQLGLSTSIQEQKVSLSSDVFHVDVLMDGGNITHVKLAHQGDVVDCPDLKEILRKGDFSEFTEHLQGLQNIYQVTNDEKLKSKPFLALQALEKDLNQLAQFQSSISGVANYIHKCPLGIMQPRFAGKPMKLIYFVSPYDLLDKRSLTAHPLTVEAITENLLGQSVTVCIEPVPDSSAPNKLQTMPLMNVSKTHEGKSLPSFSAVTKINSMMLPANFVLVLPHPVPVSTQLLQKITMLTNLEIHKATDDKSLCSLVLETYSDGKIQNSKQLYVSLPDQQHIYFLDGLNGVSQDLQGVMVSRIPFTHPTHVPQILILLRQQLLFNVVLSSCIRPAAKKEVSNTIVFEVTTVSLQQITIVFEHPAYDSMLTVDIDLSDITNLKCHITCTNPDQLLCSDEALSKIFQRCMSIPVMLRWLIAKGQHQLDKMKEAAAIAAEKEKKDNALFLQEMKQRQAMLQATLPTKGRPPPQPPHPTLPPPPSYSQTHIFSVAPLGHMGSNGQTGMMSLMRVPEVSDGTAHRANNPILLSPDSEKPQNPLLSTLLDDNLAGAVGNDSPMLSRLLDDNTSVATNVIPMTCKPTQPTIGKRPRKRRSQSEISGPSTKHRFSDLDSADRMNLMVGPMDLDMGPPLMNQGLPSTSPMIPSGLGPSGHHLHHHPHSSLNHAANLSRSHGNVIDLTEDSISEESSLKKLVDSVDKHFPHKDGLKDQDLSSLYNDPEATNRIPNILQNSPSGSKNENASTSLEVHLIGSGEVGRAKDFDPSDVATVHYSKLSTLLLAPSDSPTSTLSASSHKANSSFYSDGQLANETKGVSLLHDTKPPAGCLHEGQCSHLEHPVDKQSEKFDMGRPQQSTGRVEKSSAEIKSHPPLVPLKLRVGQNSVKPVVKSPADKSDVVFNKSNSIATFDFKSDEDEDETLHYSDNVYSSSPTRLQISSGKHKRSSDPSLSQKSDKIRKKDKNSSSTNKRKRDKEDSKREKKRKKSEHIIQEPIYRTVENDSKTDFKLKIRVAKKPLSEKSDALVDGKIHQSYEISKKSLPSPVEKIIPNKHDLKESISVIGESVKIKDANASINVHKTTSLSSGKPASVSSNPHKQSQKLVSPKLSQVSDNKTDTKLVSKATIRLKPLTMPNSGSTVNISQSGPKSSNTVAANSSKSDRRNSVAQPTTDKRTAALNTLLERRSSGSGLERRNSFQSSSSATLSTTNSTCTSSNSSVVTTSANLSISSILPDVITGIKIASLPRIPKLSSSSSNTLINRTSSLDPVSDSSLTPAGTKANNSYNTGPAGRLNSSQGPASGRPSIGGNSAFTYSRQNFNNLNRMQNNHCQASPSGNPGQSPQQRSSIRPHQSVGGNVSQKQSSVTHKASNAVLKSSTNGSNNANSSPKTGNTKLITGGNSGSKLSHSNFSAGQKSLSSATNSLSGQRQTSHGNLQRTSSNTSNVSQSPNTLTKSPSSGKSPNISSSGRSPSLSGTCKSPNITGSGKSPNMSSNISKSPNITSHSSGKSPNINTSNVANSSNRPSPSNKSYHISGSHKQSSNLNKSFNSTKGTSNIIKMPTSNTNNNIGSSKLSHSKVVNKPTVAGSNNQINKMVSLTSVCGNITLTTSAVPEDVFTSTSAQKSLIPHTPLNNSPGLSVQVTGSENSVAKLIRDQMEPCNIVKDSGDITNSVVTDKLSRSTSSTPTTPMSADGCKTKFPFSSTRGRKNSLSAIVDKLKHNAVGGLDLSLPSDELKINSSAEKFKLQNNDLSEFLRQDENIKVNIADGKVNHAIQSAGLSNDILEGVTTSELAKSLLIDVDIDSKSAKTQEEKSININKLMELNHGIDNNSFKCGLVENKQLNIRNKDKPSPLRIPLTPSSPIIQSPMSGKLSPLVSPFHSQSPQCSSPSSAQNIKSGRVIKDFEEQVFKIPSVKPVFESQSDDIVDSQTKNSKLDNDQSGSTKDNHDSKANTDHGCVKISSKLLSSPLSDISSPENGLVIDDDESSGFGSRSGADKTSSNCILLKPQFFPSPAEKGTFNVLVKPQYSKDEVNNTISQPSEDKSGSPTVEAVSAVSPKTGRVSLTRSPALAKNPQSASTPKSSDSPCEIDDDLMDVALGFGS